MLYYIFCDLGNCEMLKALLSKGANVDSFCNTGTPLHMAAYLKQDGAMKILLDHNADVRNMPLYLLRLTRSTLLIIILQEFFFVLLFSLSLIYCS